MNVARCLWTIFSNIETLVDSCWYPTSFTGLERNSGRPAGGYVTTSWNIAVSTQSINNPRYETSTSEKSTVCRQLRSQDSAKDICLCSVRRPSPKVPARASILTVQTSFHDAMSSSSCTRPQSLNNVCFPSISTILLLTYFDRLKDQVSQVVYHFTLRFAWVLSSFEKSASRLIPFICPAC